MSVKLTLLKSGETLISDMQELVADKDQQDPQAYILNNPHVVKSVKKEILTEEEKDAHAAFIQQLGENAVWNKLETKN